MSTPSTPLLVNPLAERMKKGELGLNLMIRHARTVDIALAARTCGFDGLFFDLQHGVISEQEVSQMSVAAMNMGVTPLVRVPEKDYAAALRMLDNGALGIIMPEVTTVEDARNSVAACKYPPVGNRGAFGGWAHFGYRGVPTAEARKAINDATLLILMIESKAALGQHRGHRGGAGRRRHPHRHQRSLDRPRASRRNDAPRRNGGRRAGGEGVPRQRQASPASAASTAAVTPRKRLRRW